MSNSAINTSPAITRSVRASMSHHPVNSTPPPPPSFTPSSPTAGCNTSTLPDFLATAPDVVFGQIGRFCGASISTSLAVSRFFHTALLTSSSLWYFLNLDAGKLTVFNPLTHPHKTATILQKHYWKTPTFPLDCHTAGKHKGAPLTLQQCVDRTPDGGATVVMPGVHEITQSVTVQFTKKRRVFLVGATRRGEGRAVVRFKSGEGRANEPLLRVASGTVVVQNLRLEHCSPGTDLWGGNSAVLVLKKKQRRACETIVGLVGGAWGGGGGEVIRPRIFVFDSTLTSSSGRGIVCCGGDSFMSHCLISECAGTGAYVGHKGRSAFISTDIVRNGVGADQSVVGGQLPLVAPGHSGIYCQEGNVLVQDCYVAKNTFTGISGTGGWQGGSTTPTKVSLKLYDSDFVANHGAGVELPAQDHPSWQLCDSENVNESNNALSEEQIDEYDGSEMLRSGMEENTGGDTPNEEIYMSFSFASAGAGLFDENAGELVVSELTQSRLFEFDFDKEVSTECWDGDAMELSSEN